MVVLRRKESARPLVKRQLFFEKRTNEEEEVRYFGAQ